MFAVAIALIWLGVWCVCQCGVWCAGRAGRREPAAAQRSCVPISLFMRERGQVI